MRLRIYTQRTYTYTDIQYIHTHSCILERKKNWWLDISSIFKNI